MKLFRSTARKSTAPRHALRRLLEGLESRDVPATLSIGNATATEGSTAIRFIDRFVAEGSGGIIGPGGLIFGPDANQDGAADLYVVGTSSDAVYRYDGRTGAFIDTFVPPSSGGLDQPRDLAFGPDGSLYISSELTNQVLRYDGSSGAFLGVVAGGLSSPHGLMFDSDGGLYISNQFSNEVLRYRNGTLSAFVTAGSGGLLRPRESEFGPDGNGDGVPDLYVASRGANGVYRYDGLTGAFIDRFAASPAGLPGSYPTGGFNWLQFGADGYLYTTARTASADDLNTSIVRFNAATGAFVDAFALGRDGWSFLIGPDNLIYDSSDGAGNFVERFGHASLAAFTVTLDAPSASPVTVQFTTTTGTALAGSDFTATSGTLTFAPGQTSRTILVPTVNDDVPEPTETFTVTLSNPAGATIAAGTATGTIKDDDATHFFVVDDAAADRDYQYGLLGKATGSTGLADTAPRGAASTAAGTKVWVADANKTVYVYSAAGGLLGSWAALDEPKNSTVEGIATNGTDVWVLANSTSKDKVFKYAGAASALSGSLRATSSFALNSADTNPKGIVTDGTSLWVVDDGSSADKVFKYTLAGGSLGNWTIDAANTHPTGLTIDPTDVSDIWIVDNGTDRVYQYTAAASRTSGSQSAAATFALAAGNTNPPPAAWRLPAAGRATAAPPADPARGAWPVGIDLTADLLPASDDLGLAPIVVGKRRR
jgi:Calx-beta domain